MRNSHHNAFADYLIENLDLFDLSLISLKYHNFAYIKRNQITPSNFHYLCKYNYFDFVKIIFEENDIDVNIVLKHFLLFK